MSRRYPFSTLILCFMVLTGCQDEPTNEGNDTEQPTTSVTPTAPTTYAANQTEMPETEAKSAPSEAARSATSKTATKDNSSLSREELAADDPFVISGGSVLGIRPGDDIASVNNAKKGTLKTGDGNFTVYNLMDEGGEKLGYLLPDPNDGKKIRSIHITSNMLTTPEGISVGSTFGELEKAMSGVTVYGSEVEGVTHARAGKLSFRLDAANFSYELDKSKIKPGTGITEIIVD